MIGTLVTVGVLALGGWFIWSNKDEIFAGLKSGGAPPVATAEVAPVADPTTTAAATSSEDKPAKAAKGGDKYNYGGGGYKAPKGGYKGGGGYKGTPGWYTAAGHHHCNKGENGCVCTDPPKCMGIRGTGHEACTGGRCAPGPGQCRPDLGRYGAGPCNTCPPGTGGGKCAGAGAKYARANYATSRSYFALPGENDYEDRPMKVRVGDYYSALMYPDGGMDYINNDSFAISNERISFC